jgi:hypothetical protein
VFPFTPMDGTEELTEIEGALVLGPRAGDGASLIEMMGTLGVIDAEGALKSHPLVGTADVLTDMLGIGLARPTEGAFALKPLPPPLEALTDTGGVSKTEMVGIAGPGVDLERDGGWTFSAGIEGVADGIGVFDLRDCITLGSGLAEASSWTLMIGIDGAAEGIGVFDLRCIKPGSGLAEVSS